MKQSKKPKHIGPEILLEQNQLLKHIDLNQNLKGKKIEGDLNLLGLYSHKNSISSNNSSNGKLGSKSMK